MGDRAWREGAAACDGGQSGERSWRHLEAELTKLNHRELAALRLKAIDSHVVGRGHRAPERGWLAQGEVHALDTELEPKRGLPFGRRAGRVLGRRGVWIVHELKEGRPRERIPRHVKSVGVKGRLQWVEGGAVV